MIAGNDGGNNQQVINTFCIFQLAIFNSSMEQRHLNNHNPNKNLTYGYDSY